MPDTKRKPPPAPSRVTVKAASGFYDKAGRYVRTGEVVDLDAADAADLIALNMARVHAPARG